jgi:hypothetical protein
VRGVEDSGRGEGERGLVASLPGSLRHVAEVVGLEAALRIARAFSGTYLYVPKYERVMRQTRDGFIRLEYDRGRSVKRLAAKYGLTERSVRKIIGRPPEDEAPSSAVAIRLMHGGE